MKHDMEKEHEDGGGYAVKVRRAVSDIQDSDFETADFNIPVEAENGEEVSYVITGSAKDGVLTNIRSARLYLDDDESEAKKQPKLKKIFGGETADEENDQ